MVTSGQRPARAGLAREGPARPGPSGRAEPGLGFFWRARAGHGPQFSVLRRARAGPGLEI